MSAADYGIWLKHDALGTRKHLAQALCKHYGSYAHAVRDGSSLRVIFIDRDQVCHVFSDVHGACADKSIEPERNWPTVSQRAALVLIS